MRIAYSYCLNGLGHKVPSSLLINAIRARGHEVLVVEDVPKIIVKVEDNEVKDCYYENTQHSDDTIEDILDFNPETIITDFEPFLNSMGAKLAIPTISIESMRGQYRMVQNPLYKNLIEEVCRYSTKLIDVNFYPSTQENFGPITDVVKQEVPTKGKFLVYSTWDSSMKNLLPKFKDFEPVIFSGEKLNNREAYKQELATCDFVVTNGGHGIISEALVAGKPLFCIPTKGHEEKEINCRIVEVNSWGCSNEEEFLSRFDEINWRVNNYNLQPANLEKLIDYALGK